MQAKTFLAGFFLAGFWSCALAQIPLSSTLSQQPLPTPDVDRAAQKAEPNKPAAALGLPEQTPEDPNQVEKTNSEDTARGPDQPTRGADQPIRGADSRDSSASAPDYMGPAILSRGFTIPAPAVPAHSTFRPYGGVGAIYDSGLTTPFNAGTGVTQSTASGGVELNWGLRGRHYGRKDLLEIDYHGHYYNYSSASQYNGQDQGLLFSYVRAISSRISFGVSETAGVYTNSFSVLNNVPLSDTSIANTTLVVTPNTQATSARSTYSTTQASMLYRYNARLTFVAGAAGFLTTINAQNAANVQGSQTFGGANYRITKRSTVGAYYAYLNFFYTKAFGGTVANSFGGNYSLDLTKGLTLAVRAGATHYETLALGEVPLNPLVAAVLGQTTGIEKFYIVGVTPDISGTLTKNLQHASVGVSFFQGISPGNGYTLTSNRDSESVFYQYSGIRKYTFGVGGGRDSLTSVTIGQPNFASYYVRFTSTHPLNRSLNSYLNFDFRNYAFDTAGDRQNEFRISVGVNYSPVEGPLKFW